VAIGRPQGPDDWQGTDIIATASLVGAIFGNGGGRELDMALFLQRLQHRFGAQEGRRLWEQLAAFDDPDAPTTVKRTRFPYQEGWYGYAAKDLRQVLGQPVAERYTRTFCGGGSLATCRAALRASLQEALAVPAAELYSGDAICRQAKRDGDQTCWDAISFRPLGVSQPLIPWVNRPTYQQAVEIAGHRPR
jgi:hypothetical protein